MPEVILPCPACGAVENESDKFGLSYRLGVQIVCHKCGMYGPVAEDFNEAVGKWNALPRALRWTHEPPKVAGFYFLKMASGTMSMVYLSDQDIKDKDWHGYVGQWIAIAGPISPPID